MTLSQTQIQEFNDKGTLLIKGLFNEDSIKALSLWLEELKTKQPAYGEEAKYYEISNLTGENFLARVENVVGEYNPKMSNLLLQETAIESLTQLFNDKPVLFKDKVNYKLPGCRPDLMHQDQAAGWGRYANFFITMVIAIDENRQDNAAISFMKTGNYSKKLMSDEWVPLEGLDPEDLPQDEYQMVDLNPGDVVFFDSFVPHGSAANSGDRQRRNIFLTFNAASEGDHKKEYYADKWENYPPNSEDEARNADTFLV